MIRRPLSSMKLKQTDIEEMGNIMVGRNVSVAVDAQILKDKAKPATEATSQDGSGSKEAPKSAQITPAGQQMMDTSDGTNTNFS